MQTHAQLQEYLQQLTTAGSPHVLAFVNAHAMNSAATSDHFYKALTSADTLLRDGSGMATLFKMMSLQPGLNLNGTDLIPKIIHCFNGQPIALYGTEEPYLGQCRSTVHASIAPLSELQTANGFLPIANYIELAQSHRPRLIVLGMGMPKQEEVAAELRKHITSKCLIVCGGAIIDFLGNRVSRAPRWMRQIGIEWLYRLALEPRRLFKRYVLGNPLFILRAHALRTNKTNIPFKNDSAN